MKRRFVLYVSAAAVAVTAAGVMTDASTEQVGQTQAVSETYSPYLIAQR